MNDDMLFRKHLIDLIQKGDFIKAKTYLDLKVSALILQDIIGGLKKQH